MERQFRINWGAIVEEARQRRKSQKLTQRRLAELASVSTPTISRFESGEREIQLSGVTSILAVLGMLDERTLIFADTNARHDPMRGAVLFDGKDGDHKDKLKVFNANRENIEHEARRKYLAGIVEADGSILIRTGDL